MHIQSSEAVLDWLAVSRLCKGHLFCLLQNYLVEVASFGKSLNIISLMIYALTDENILKEQDE